MAVEEYKDVLRVETTENGLGPVLRNKQLGFERIVKDTGVEVRMGYMDSTGVLHYFTRGGAVSSEYWEPADWGIHYSGGNVAIGKEPESQNRFEVRSNVSTVYWQIRTSYSDSCYADMGVDAYGKYRIYLNRLERLSLSSTSFGLVSEESKLTYENSEMLLQTDVFGSTVKIKTGTSGNIILEPGPGGGLVFKSNDKMGKMEYDESNEKINIDCNIAVKYNKKLYLNYYTSEECSVYGDADGTLHLQSVNKVDIVSKFLKLPVKTTTGHPSGGQEGCIYINKADKKVCLYIDSSWRDLFSW